MTTFKEKSIARQESAWAMLHKSELAYEKGHFETALKLDRAFCRLTEESIYFDQLAQKTK